MAQGRKLMTFENHLVVFRTEADDFLTGFCIG
jgi:hypothetical protein